MNPKVYVVFFELPEEETYRIEGIYSDNDKAKEYVKRKHEENTNRRRYWYIEEHQVQGEL